MFTTRRVAVVEGDRQAAEMLHTFLRLMELDCALIPSDSRAIPTLRRERPDVLIVDLALLTHDAAGNVTQIHDQLHPRYDRNFGYDDLNRLITANTGSLLWGTGSFSYDAMGNLLQQTLGTATTTFAYHGTTPKLTGVTSGGTTRALSYDPAGNEITAGTAKSSYLPRNHLRATGVMEYAYDGRGVRTVSARTPATAEIQSLTADKPSPQQTNTTVTFTTQALGGVAPLRYQFQVRNLTTGGSWSNQRPWSSSPSWSWTLGHANAGTWEVKAEVTSANSYLAQSSRTMTFVWYKPQASIDSFTVDQPSPQMTGTTVTFATVASGGEAPLRYQFQVRNLTTGGSWINKRPLSTTPTWSWTPGHAEAGTWEVKAEVMSASSYQAESSRTMTFVWYKPQANIDSFTSDKPSPQLPGTTVTFTTVASGGEAPLRYQFQIRNLTTNGYWINKRPWSSTSSWSWTPGTSEAGTWEIKAEVASANVYQAESSRSMTFAFYVPALLSSFSADKPSPQPVGTPITWTAVSSGTVPLEYQFERRDGETWSVVQPYSATAAYVWTPAAEDVGEHSVRVLVRASGSVEAFDDTGTVDMTIVPPSTTLGAPAAPILCASTALEPCLSVKSIMSAALMATTSVATTTAGALARYSLYTPELSLLAETAETTGDQKPVAYEYIWFGGQPLAQIATATGTIHWYFNDHLGTPVLQTDATASVVWRAEATPYGEIHTYRTGGSKHQPLRFPGQEQEVGGGELSYNVFRWYRAGWGRYTQADPLGSQGDPHAYLYAAANPVRSFDRYGLKAEVVCAGITLFGLPWTPFRHCRIRVTCEKCEGGNFGGPYDTSVGLERNRRSPRKELHVTQGPVGAEYTYSYPINNVDQNDSCKFGRCVRALAATYRDDADRWTPQYSIFGPNSNSFAGHIMRWCGGVGPPDGPFGATGFNQPLGFE